MGAARPPVSAPLVATPAAPAPLQLFALCTPFVVAVAADAVDRLLLPHEVRLVPAPGLAPPASLGTLAVAGIRYSAWDLGALLGLPSQDGAFVLVRPRAEGHPPMALRTGPCLSVAPLQPDGLAPLSPGLFRARRGAFTSAFGAVGLRAGREDVAPIGLALDITRLWSPDELEHAHAALLAPEAEPS